MTRKKKVWSPPLFGWQYEMTYYKLGAVYVYEHKSPKFTLTVVPYVDRS